MDCWSQQVFFTIYIKLTVMKAMGIVMDIDILVRGIQLAEISYVFLNVVKYTCIMDEKHAINCIWTYDY